jgi:acetyl-CoA carboxylase carboxyltransferase component
MRLLRKELAVQWRTTAKAGNAHFACENDADAIEQIKFSELPAFEQYGDPPRSATTDESLAHCPDLDESSRIIPE